MAWCAAVCLLLGQTGAYGNPVSISGDVNPSSADSPTWNVGGDLWIGEIFFTEWGEVDARLQRRITRRPRCGPLPIGLPPQGNACEFTRAQGRALSLLTGKL